VTDGSAGGANPFPGLRPFRTEEHHLFFGREEQTAALLALLREHRFLAVVGTSGSGKSSLVRAGLIPALHRGTMARAGSTWEVIILRPGGNPITSLGQALIDGGLYDAGDPEALLRLRATLTRSHFGLVEAVRQSGELDPAANLLVVVDQFEEIFRFREQGTSSEETATAFVGLLLSASESEERRIYVAITMRSDYLGDCANIPGLAEAVNRGEYLIPRLSRDQRREAIEKPVGVGGARIAPRLVQHMLNDLGDDPDQLPVLQHALMRTWDAWNSRDPARVGDHRDGEPLDLRHYESTGGMAAALSRHADEVFEALPDDDHRRAAERVFKALTVKGADNRGIRRPTRLGRLARIAGASEDVVSAVVEAYRRPGVTFLMPGTGTRIGPDTVIDLSHESLMRVWNRLSGWVEEEAQSARVYRRLAETADLWKLGKAGLFRDPDLQIALAWRETARPNEAWAEQHGGGLERAMEFLDRSRDTAMADQLAWEQARHRELMQARALAEAERRRAEDRQRAAKRLKVLAAGVAAVAVLAIVASIFAVNARREAVENARLASEKEALATRAAGDAERSAAALKRTLVESDFHQGAERIAVGEGAEGLAHLARALRTDPGFWPAGMRAMSALASGRFPLRGFERIAHEKVIMAYHLNEKEDLLFTSDFSNENDDPKRFVWDARTGERLYPVAPERKGLGQPGWTQDGKLLFAHDFDGKAIRSWDARTGKEIEPPIAAEGIVGFRDGEDPQGRTLYMGQFQDGAIQVWRAPGGEPATPRLTRAARATGGLGFTPDGRHVFGTFADATIAIWEAEGGAPVVEISTRPWPIQDGGVLFTPDSRTVLWRADHGKKVNWRRIAGEDAGGPWLELEEPLNVFFLPGGSKVAFLRGIGRALSRIDVHEISSRQRTASIATGLPGPVQGWFVPSRTGSHLSFPLVLTREGNAVRVWDLEKGTLFREILAPALLSRAELSPECRRVLTATTTHDVMLWDIFTGRPLLAEPIEHEGALDLTFSPEGETLITHDMEKRLVQVWDTRTGRRIAEPYEQANVSAFHFTEGGHRLLVWNKISTTRGPTFEKVTEGDFRVLDVGLRPALFEAILDGTGFPHAFWSPRGDIVVYGRERAADPNELTVWDGASRRRKMRFPLPAGVDANPDAFALSPDGTRAILGSEDGRARVYDLVSGEVLHELAHESYLATAGVSPDGSRAATGTGQGKVQLWDLATGAPLSEPLDHGSQVITEVIFSPDGSLLASGSVDFKFRLADGRTGAQRFEPLATNNIVGGSVFSPDGSHVAVTPFSSDVLIVETGTGSVVRKLPHVDACRLARFSPDGRLLAAGTGGHLHIPVGEVYLWDWREGRKVGRPLNTRGAVEYMEFSRDGALLVTGTILTDRGAVQVWDVATGQPLTEQVEARSGVNSVAFNAAGTEVVAAWQGGLIRVIDLPPRDARETAWLPMLAESVAGRRLAPQGGIEEVPREDLDRLRAEHTGGAASGKPGEPHEQWIRWFLADPEERTISPGSRVAFRDHLAGLRRSDRVQDLQEALRLAPSDPLTHARLGYVLLEVLAAQGELDAAKERDLELRRHWEATADWYGLRAVELGPRDAEVWALRAETLDWLGRKAEAAGAAARALAIDPSRPNALYLKAVALAGDGKWEEADGTFAKALEGLSAPAADGGAATTGVPLLGILEALEPAVAPEGFRDLRIPPPIPGTFEDFDSAPEGGLPAGWTVRHEKTDAPREEAVSGRISNAESDVFEDWVIVSLDRAAANEIGPPFYADRLLAADRRERLNGTAPAPLLEGRFIYSLGGDRDSSFAHHLFTPDLDCTGRKAVHAVFASAYEQATDSFAAVEYSIDEGKTWLPVLYRLNGVQVIRDASGKVDAAATLGGQASSAPLYVDDAGEPRGRSHGEIVGAPVTRALDPHIEGLRPFDWVVAKRVEVHRLPLADGQPKVRLRFLHAGRFGWYWGIDDYGLHEIPEGPVAGTPRLVDRTRDPMALAGTGLAAILGTDRTSAILQPRDLYWVTPEERQGTGTAGTGVPGGASRRLADGRLLIRRAAALAPDNAWVLLASAFASARGGAADDAVAAARRARAREPVSRLSAQSLAAVYLAKGDALERAGDSGAAAVAHEMAHVLFKAPSGNADSGILKRLAAAGLAGKSEVLLARGSEWRYFDEGVDPGPDWKEPGFDDTLWPRGKARLGYGNDGEQTLVSFGSDPQRKHVTTYFRGGFEGGDPGRFAQLKLSVARDDGIVVYLNGREAFRDNMPQGAVDAKTLATTIVGDADEERFFEFEAAAEGMVPGRNTIAAEVHQQASNSSDLGFDLEIEGVGGLKEVVRPASDLDAIEERLEIPADLRSVLWASRAERFRRAGDLERAAEAIERAERMGPRNPTVAYERAHILRARGDEDAAHGEYRKAVEGAIGLKAGARSPYGVFLPDSLRATVESLVRPSGVGLAGAARRIARVASAPRDVEGRWLLRWSDELDASGHAARLERAEALLALGSPAEALAIAEAALAPGGGGEPARTRGIRQGKDWLALKEQSLRRLGRLDDADRVTQEVLAPPPRNPGLSAKLIDLSAHYTASIYDGRGWHATENLRTLPETFRPRGGIEFDIRGMIQLQSGRYPRGTMAISGKDMNELYDKSFPQAVKGIRIGLEARALHFLTAASWCHAASGAEVARVVVHYDDGGRAECPIRAGEDVTDWATGNNPRIDADRIAWVGNRPPRRLMRKTWTNPSPAKTIREIDFVSAMTTAAPFLVAVTAE
jgi:WD40 repeat protein/tetratricopeptide (TPR) repeat protein